MAIRVLILDDETLFGQSLVQSLELCEDPPIDALAVTTAAEAIVLATAAELAGTPFDTFLIDQRLGPGADGVEVLKQLLDVSPRSDAIVFTIAGDREAGLRAYQAGAYRYLHKPFRAEELVLALQMLQRLRETRIERDWLRVIASIAEAAQRLLSLTEVQREIVLSGKLLGFERTRLWLYDRERTEMVCVDQEGQHGDATLAGFRFPAHKSPYMQRLLERELPEVFHAQDHGDSFLFQTFAARGYRAPVGDWVGLPLRTSAGLIGVLMLDNYEHERSIPRDQLDALSIFGRQVVVALERAQLHEREQRQSRELAVMAAIGRLISDGRATHSLPLLLLEIQRQVNDLMPVDNYFIALYNEETNRLDLRLEIECGVRQRDSSLSPRVGLVSWVFARSEPLLLNGAEAIERFAHANQIRRKGTRALCWLGVPLILDAETIGAVVVQSYSDAHAYTEEDRRLLAAVAAQVAGAVHTARLSEEAERDRTRLRSLVDAGRDLIRLARDDEQRFWHLVLTIATAGYAIGFNRAMLLLLSPDGSALKGRLGIGHLSSRKDRDAWRHDEARRLDLAGYRRLVEGNGITTSDLHDQVVSLTLPLADDLFAQVLRERRPVLAERQGLGALPSGFVRAFGRHSYALLPIYAGEKRFGVLVVDNSATGMPLLQSRLDQLEAWLAQAALAFENRRQHLASEQLVSYAPDLLAHAADQPLKVTLDAICELALALTAADNAMIYPLDAEQERFDAARIGLAGGLLHPFDSHEIPDITPADLRGLAPGALRVHSDLDAGALDGRHAFIKREHLRASIAAALHMPVSGEPVGLLYLNYRNRQIFSEHELDLARNLARLSAAMIGTANKVGSARDRVRIGENELSLLSRVLGQSLEREVDQKALARILLDAARDLLVVPNWQVGLILRSWQPPAAPDAAAVEGRLRIFYGPHSTTPVETEDNELYRGITGYALTEGEDQLIEDVEVEPWKSRFRRRFPDSAEGVVPTTRSELDVLITLDGQHLGLFNIESPKVAAFTEEHHQRLRRLADVAALALDNVQRREHQRSVLQASGDVVAASSVDDTLGAILRATRRAAPDVSAVTIWRVDVERGLLVPGPNFGLREPDMLVGARIGADGALSRILKATEPIWVEQVSADAPLWGAFAAREGIVSVVAFPLSAGGEPVGVLCFNYRTPHRFSRYEQVLFETFATLVSGALRDALHLDLLRREQERLAATIRVAEAVGPTLDLEGTLRKIFATLRDLFQARGEPLKIAVLLFDAQTRMLNFHAVSQQFYDPRHLEELPALNVNRDRSIACRAAREAIRRNGVVCENVGDVRRDEDYLEVNGATRSEFCLALMGTELGKDGRHPLLGLLVVESDQLNAFDDDDVKLLSGVGRTIGLAIERVRTSSKLQLDSAIAAATVWVHEVAHEINREIGAIRVGVSTMLEDRHLSPSFHEPLLKIDASADRLRQAALDPRSLSPVPLRIEAWLRGYVEQKVQPPIQVQFEFTDPAIEVLAVEVLLERAVSHLVRNARKAMTGDGLPRGRLRFRVWRVGDMARIAIDNDGPPIPEYLRERLLVERIDTRDGLRSGEGGLGLLFVRWAIEAMNGSVRLVSLKQPVSFEIALPLAPKQSVPRGYPRG